MLRDRDLEILRGRHQHKVVTYTVDYQSPDERTPVNVYGIMEDVETGQRTLATIRGINSTRIILDETVLVPVVRRGMDRARDAQQSDSHKGKEGDPTVNRTYRLAFVPPIR